MLLWKFLNFLIENCKCARGGHSRVGELFFVQWLGRIMIWCCIQNSDFINKSNQSLCLAAYSVQILTWYEILKFKYWSNRTYHLTFWHVLICVATCHMNLNMTHDSCCFDMFDSDFQIWLNWRDSTIRCYFWFDCNIKYYFISRTWHWYWHFDNLTDWL